MKVSGILSGLAFRTLKALPGLNCGAESQNKGLSVKLNSNDPGGSLRLNRKFIDEVLHGKLPDLGPAAKVFIQGGHLLIESTLSALHAAFGLLPT